MAQSLLVTVAVIALGCAPSEDAPPDSGGSGSFIALAPDFADFATWPAITLGAMDGTRGHDAGISRIHLRGVVPAPSEPFATGTILVKVTETTPSVVDWEVHAMVKRGGDYNATGAVGWEWFDLALTADGEPVITWRGEGSASDPGSYGGLETDAGPFAQTCNGCHGVVDYDDYVFDRAELGALD